MSKKTSIISARLPDDIKQRLESAADTNGTTLSTLITQILSRYAEWDVFAKDLGFIFSTRKFLEGILSEVPRPVIEKIASTTCKDAVKEVITFAFSKVTLDGFVKTLHLWLSASAIPFKFIPNAQNDGGKFMIQHKLGQNYSVYILSMSGTLLDEIGYKLSNIESNEDNVNFEVSLAE